MPDSERVQKIALTRLLVLAIACGLALASNAMAAGPERGAADSRAPQAGKAGTVQLRGDSRAARRSDQRRRARQARRQRRARRAARRRLSRQQQSARQHLKVSDQIPLTGKPKAVAAQNPEILFRGDFESGFDGWYVQSPPSRATLFSSGVFQGAGAARLEVQDGDIEPDTGSERSEVSGPTFDEGQDLYIRDAIRIPSASTYDGPWQIVQQLHETDWGGSPGIAVFLDSGDTLSIGSGDGDTTYWEGAELQRDRWYDLVYRVYLSNDPGVGFVEVWLDGVQQDLEAGTRAYGQTIQTEHTYIKAGIYRSRSSTGTSLIEHDSIVVGTSLAAVTAG